MHMKSYSKLWKYGMQHIDFENQSIFPCQSPNENCVITLCDTKLEVNFYSEIPYITKSEMKKNSKQN